MIVECENVRLARSANVADGAEDSVYAVGGMYETGALPTDLMEMNGPRGFNALRLWMKADTAGDATLHSLAKLQIVGFNPVLSPSPLTGGEPGIYGWLAELIHTGTFQWKGSSFSGTAGTALGATEYLANVSVLGATTDGGLGLANLSLSVGYASGAMAAQAIDSGSPACLIVPVLGCFRRVGVRCTTITAGATNPITSVNWFIQRLKVVSPHGY